MGETAAPQTSRTTVTATFDMVDKYELLIKVLMEPPALFILQQNVLTRKHYLEIIKMALNNVRRDSWFKCKIKDGKERHNLTRRWSKSICKRLTQRKVATQCLLPVVSLPGENSCILNAGKAQIQQGNKAESTRRN